MTDSFKRPLRILLVGGGSGGHILPLLAVSQQIGQACPDCVQRVWCDRKTYPMAQDLWLKDPEIKVGVIQAGKFRRYYHLKWWQHLQWSIFWPNLRDGFLVLIGFFQSIFKMIAWRPDVVFVKGGYVCLPAGLAAGLLRIKIVIHDSDTVPGLTNRVLARFAYRIATGFPTGYYGYKSQKMVYTGIPVKDSLRPVKPSTQQQIKKKLGLDPQLPLVLVTGGGMGSRFVNKATVDSLIKLNRSLSCVIASGQVDYGRVSEQIEQSSSSSRIKFVVKPFFSNLDQYVLASDLIVSRAGATILSEIAAARKLAIVIPNPKLAGGHQNKNAQSLAQVIELISETEIEQDADLLGRKIAQQLDQDINSVAIKQKLDKLHRLSKPKAADDLARIILEAAKGGGV